MMAARLLLRTSAVLPFSLGRRCVHTERVRVFPSDVRPDFNALGGNTPLVKLRKASEETGCLVGHAQGWWRCDTDAAAACFQARRFFFLECGALHLPGLHTHLSTNWG